MMYRTEPRHGLLAGPQPKEPQLIDRATFLSSMASTTRMIFKSLNRISD